MHRWLVVLLLSFLVACLAPLTVSVRAEDKPHVGGKADPAHPEGSGKAAHGDVDIFGKALDLALWTLLVFLILLFILRKSAWGPMMEGLKKREEDIRSATESAQRAREETARISAQLQAEMGKAHEKVRELLEEARRDGEHTRQQKLAEAEAQIQVERERALREINTARDQARDELTKQAAVLATLISSKAIRRNLTQDDHRSLVDEALSDLQQAVSERRV